MRTLILFVIVSFCCLLVPQSFAELPIAPGAYNSICFIDSVKGWVCGNNGSIMHTSNGGIDWITQSTGITLNLYKIKFTNLLVGWAVGDSGLILHTDDGGIFWDYQDSGVLTALTSLAVTDQMNAWVFQQDYTNIILHTSNGGENWVEQHTDQNYDWLLTSCVFFNNDTGFVSGFKWDQYSSGSTVQYTTDGGNSWYHCPSSNVGILESISFIDRNHGWAVGDNIAQIKTTDGGQSWSNINSLLGKWLNGVFFVTKDSGWVLQYFTYGNKIHFTADGGNSWVDQTIPSNEALNEIFFINNRRGWAVGPNHIFYTNNAGNNWSLNPVSVLSVDDNITSFNYQLYQNYPNPFNPATSIQYAISSRQFVSLKVYDVLGNEVATLVNEYRNAGNYEINFDANKLSSGVYYYQLRAGNFVQSKKMVLLR